jgi:hypothetical protein
VPVCVKLRKLDNGRIGQWTHWTDWTNWTDWTIGRIGQIGYAKLDILNRLDILDNGRIGLWITCPIRPLFNYLSLMHMSTGLFFRRRRRKNGNDLFIRGLRKVIVKLTHCIKIFGTRQCHHFIDFLGNFKMCFR